MKPAAAVAALGVLTVTVIALPVGVVIAVLLLASQQSPAAAAGTALSDEVPEGYRDALAAAAAGCGLSAPLLAAQLAVESDWNPRAVSPAGAMGLAQMMPGTWATWGRDGDGDGTADVLDPIDAIAGQGALMCSLYDRATDVGWGDPVDLALAGYNAGWGAVVRYRGVPPYPETISYVARIRGLVDRYTAPVPAMPAEGGQAVWPLDDPDPITNGFGNHPTGIDYELGYHTGIDLNADRRLGGTDYGQPVRAARSGLVNAVRHDGALGNHVVIEHPDGYYTAYAHLSQILVTPGQAVTAGQQIGAVGCSGMSTCGPHLHFEVRKSPRWAAGNFVDPLTWLGLEQP